MRSTKRKIKVSEIPTYCGFCRGVYSNRKGYFYKLSNILTPLEKILLEREYNNIVIMYSVSEYSKQKSSMLFVSDRVIN